MKSLTQNHTLVALGITLFGALVQAVTPAVHEHVVAFVTAHPDWAALIGTTIAGLLSALPGLNHKSDG